MLTRLWYLETITGCEPSKLLVVVAVAVLRRVFGPKRDELTGEWRKLSNEELNDLYSLPNIVRVVKSRRMRWGGHVVRIGEDRGGAQMGRACGVYWGR